jgi:hypothetical protein
MSETEQQWLERVRSWRASGKSAGAFAAEHGYAEATLRWWASRLSRPHDARRRRDRTRATPPASVALVRVVRKDASPSTSGSEVVVKIGAGSIVVTRGSDEHALRLAVRVLEGAV